MIRTELTEAQACELTKREPKALLGLAMRNEFDDPIVVDKDADGRPIYANSVWRMMRLVPSI